MKLLSRIVGGALIAAAATAAAGPLLRISEVMCADNTAFADEDGTFADWIEVVNAGDAAASLAGWGLTDDAVNEPLKWAFPDLALNTNECLLVWASGKDRRPPFKTAAGPFVVAPSNSVWRYRDNGLAPDAGWAGTNFSDSAWASGLALLGYGSSFPQLVTTVSYGPNASSKYPATYFRQTFVSPVSPHEARTNGVLRLWVDDGAVVYLNGAEILRVRMPAGAVSYQTLASAVASGSHGLWETFEVPVTALVKGTNVLAVEVHQQAASSSDIALWAELSLRTSAQHANFKLNAGRETVTLSDPSGAAVDAAPPLTVPSNASYGRLTGQPGGEWLMFPYPTPGAPNGTSGYTGLLAAPAFSVAPGFYAAPVTVAITNADAAAQIYYTLDGSTPTNVATASCFLYTGPLTLTDRSPLTNTVSMIRTNPIEMTNHTVYGWMAPSGLVSKCSVIRATAARPGLFCPRDAAGSWFVGGVATQHTLRVFSFVSDYADLFGDPKGLFVPGDVYKLLGWNGHYVGLPNANYFQRGDTWERPLHVQLFATNRTLEVSQLMGVRNHGAYSRAAAQKSLLLYARSEYGNSQMDCRLYADQTDTGFKRVLLHNGGNDWCGTGFHDELAQQVFRPSTRCDTQDYEPAVTYVNGEYWGVENIREHYSKYYFERHYGVDPDNLDFLKAPPDTEILEVEEGDDLNYREVLAFTKTNDLTVAVNYAWVESRIDFDSMIDHYACEIYCCNTDWPGNNIGFWRVRTAYNPAAPYGHDGRWRWTIYDTDGGFNNASVDMMNQARRSSRGLCQPQFNRLLYNTDFRNRFVNRFADLINSSFQPARVVGVISNVAARVDAEMPRHIARWGRMVSYSTWQSRVNAMKNFAALRPANALTNIVNEFGLVGMARLTVDLTNGTGRVSVNTLTIDAATPGLANPAKPYPWRGAYFKTVPVTVSVTPDPGFTFVRWDTSAGPLVDQTLSVTTTNDLTLRAVLEPALLPRVAVNEVMADATKAGGGQLHPVTGNAEDWFELLNESPAAVDLGGFWLVDSQPDNACAIPAGVVLQPGACLRVWTGSGLTAGLNPDGSLNATFGLGKGGDAVALQTPNRRSELDRVTFGAQTSNVSQGRWPNGAAGEWVSFSKPTPGLPNRSPSATAELLPLYGVQSVAALQPLALSFAPTSSVEQAVYALAEGQTGAVINASGTFEWTPPLSLGSGVYSFRIALLGLTNGVPVADETTLLVAVHNPQRYQIETFASPREGGSVTGGGAYESGGSVTLTAAPEELWRFTGWSDGMTSISRTFAARRDATYTALFAYGLLAPALACGTVEGGKPLLYWSAVQGAERYAVRRSASRAGPFALLGIVTNNVFVDAAPLAGVDAYYTVAALHGATEGPASAAFQAFASGATRKLTGSVIGTLGSWSNSGNTREKVFDGDINTFYDAAADGGWPGQEYDGERWRRLAYLRYAPRSNTPGRMVNGRFQVSSASDTLLTFESPETLHTVTSSPPVGVYTTVPLNLDRRFRFLRYLPPTGGFGNIAELEVYGCDSVPDAPAAPSATGGIRSVSLTWGAVTNAVGYLVRRAASAAGPYETVAYVESAAYAEGGLADGTNLFYRVASVNGSGVSSNTAALTGSSAPAPTIPCFAAAARRPSGAAADGAVTLRLSSALDPRLELVCSASLATPPSQWQPVGAAAFSAAEPVTGAVLISVTTNAPQLFFAVRLRPH